MGALRARDLAGGQGSPGALLDVRPPRRPSRGDRPPWRRGGGLAGGADLERRTVLRSALTQGGAKARLRGGGPAALRRGAAEDRLLPLRLGRPGEALSEDPVAGLVLADWTSIARRPRAPLAFRHVVLVDPPPSEPLEDLAWAAAAPAAIGRGPSAYIHLAWGPAEADLAERLIDGNGLRAAIREIWRGLTETGGEAAGSELRSCRRRVGLFPDGRARGPLCAGAQRARSVRMAADWRQFGPAGLILGEDRSRAIAGLRGLRRQAPGGHQIPPKRHKRRSEHLDGRGGPGRRRVARRRSPRAYAGRRASRQEPHSPRGRHHARAHPRPARPAG